MCHHVQHSCSEGPCLVKRVVVCCRWLCPLLLLQEPHLGAKWRPLLLHPSCLPDWHSSPSFFSGCDVLFLLCSVGQESGVWGSFAVFYLVFPTRIEELLFHKSGSRLDGSAACACAVCSHGFCSHSSDDFRNLQ